VYKKGDLLEVCGMLTTFLGNERTKEKYDAWGNGGLFVGEVKVMVVSEPESPHYQGGRRTKSRVGRIMWVERGRAKKVSP